MVVTAQRARALEARAHVWPDSVVLERGPGSRPADHVFGQHKRSSRDLMNAVEPGACPHGPSPDEYHPVVLGQDCCELLAARAGGFFV